MSAQLQNIGPQLTSLETALTESRNKLKKEQQLRRQAEQGQDEAESRMRELEHAMQNVKEECDVVHEELAFKENELEETRLELEIEKQQLENELAQLRHQMESGTPLDSNNAARVSEAINDGSADDGYIKKLEEELELVTEQLIETEKRLSETEDQLEKVMSDLPTNTSRSPDDDDLIQKLQMENADLMETSQRLRDELELTKEELTLAKEEIHLQQEEIQSTEADAKRAREELDEERIKFRDQVNRLQIEAKEATIAQTSSLGEAAMVASTIREAEEENQALQEQLAGMEAALENARKDYQAVLDELETVNARFDEAMEQAREEGREEAMISVRERVRTDVDHEMKELKDKLARLEAENNDLQRKVDETEIALASNKDRQIKMTGGTPEQSELVKRLQAQLVRTKEDLSKKDKEMSALATTLEERLKKAEEKVAHLENELHLSKGKLAEAEARVIVLTREKETADMVIPQPLPRRSPKSLSVDGLPSRGRSFDREELLSMDEKPSQSNIRNRSRSSSPSIVKNLEYRLEEENKKLRELQKEYEALLDQKRMGEVRIKRLEEDLRTLQKELFRNQGGTAVATQMSRLSSLAQSNERAIQLIGDDDDMGKRLRDVIESRDVKLMTEEILALEKRFNGQREYNAQLLSKMLHLQGNIQVYCRVRPMTVNEIQKGNKCVVEALSESEVGCFDSRTNKWKSFVFDRVWGPDQPQQTVFQDVEPLALSVVDGFNACIFAYGQTGSGKTYTMEGVSNSNQYGISYRTIQKIFHLLKLRAQQQRAAQMFVGSSKEDEPAEEVSFSFSIEIGMLEIYNDEIYDLLATEGSSTAEKIAGAKKAGGKASLEIRRNKADRIEVPNLTKQKVEDIEEVMELLKRGNANRATASTDMNEHSSRSHMVLSVEVSSGLDETQRNRGTLYLIDLAGSERVRKSHVEGDQLKEAGFINKSLSALGNVMEALDRKAAHIPYRDSKLTYLLQDSLGGNSRTMMIVAINPIDDSYDESANALQFATRVRRIQIGAAQRNVSSKNLEETVKALTDEMRSLARAKERTESQLHSLKRDNTRVQEKLANLSKSKQQSRQDSKTLDVLRKNNDDMANRWQREKALREEQAEELENTRKELRTVQQELSKTQSKMQMLEEKLGTREKELEAAGIQLRQERTIQSATALRSRRDQLLSTRKRPPTASGIPAPSTPKEGKKEESPDVGEIRSKVLDLLQKYDVAKVDRIDIIMEKFKGKESLLLEKMSQRYEGLALGPSVQKRNELALKRHEERMRKIRENKVSNGSDTN